MDSEPSKHPLVPRSGYEPQPPFEAPRFAGLAPASAEARRQSVVHPPCGHGKVILLGEHAVVYGSHAIAAPIPLAMRASVQAVAGRDGVALRFTHDEMYTPHDDTYIQPQADQGASDLARQTVQLVLCELGLAGHALEIRVASTVPQAMGLGSSAAFAVAVIRALDRYFKLALDDAQVNVLAFHCEELAHGTPSGIDNTVATYGELVLYQRGEETRQASRIQPLKITRPLPLVIGVSGHPSLTAQTVAAVRRAWQREPARYDAIFREIDDLVLQGVQALQRDDLPRLGALMDACHTHLQRLRVSSDELDELVGIARANGALGAKLTGGGRGGSIVALCPTNRAQVASALRSAGYQALEMNLG